MTELAFRAFVCNYKALDFVSFMMAPVWNKLFGTDVAEMTWGKDVSVNHMVRWFFAFPVSILSTLAFLLVGFTAYAITNAKALSDSAKIISDTYNEIFKGAEASPKSWGDLWNATGVVTRFVQAAFIATAFINAAGRALGISAYSANNLMWTLKLCSNYLLGSNHSLQAENEVLTAEYANEPKWKFIANRIGLFGWIMKGMALGVTLTLAALGLSAANYHQYKLWDKQCMNPSHHENKQLNTEAHEKFLKDANGDRLSAFFVQYNLLRVIGKFALAVFDFAIVPATVYIISPAVYLISSVISMVWNLLTCCCRQKKRQMPLEKHIDEFRKAVVLDPKGALPKQMETNQRYKEPGSYAEDMHTTLNQNLASKESFCARLPSKFCKSTLLGGLLNTWDESAVDKIKTAYAKYIKRCKRNREASSTNDFFNSPELKVQRDKIALVPEDKALMFDRLCLAVKYSFDLNNTQNRNEGEAKLSGDHMHEEFMALNNKIDSYMRQHEGQYSFFNKTKITANVKKTRRNSVAMDSRPLLGDTSDYARQEGLVHKEKPDMRPHHLLVA